MFKLVAISLIAAYLSLSNSKVIASGSLSVPLTRNELITLLEKESKSASKRIVITSMLIGNLGSPHAEPYNLDQIKVARVRNWLVWYHQDENIDSIRNADSKSRALISKYLPNDLKSGEVLIQFSGVESSVASKAYSDMCRIPLDTTYNQQNAKYIWSAQTRPYQIKEICLDFGLQLAAIGFVLKEQNNMLLRTDYLKSVIK